MPSLFSQCVREWRGERSKRGVYIYVERERERESEFGTVLYSLLREGGDIDDKNE